MKPGTQFIAVLPEFSEVMKAITGRHSMPIPVMFKDGSRAHVVINDVTDWADDGFTFNGLVIQGDDATPARGKILSISRANKGHVTVTD